MDLDDERVLITGGSGVIGRYMIDLLSDMGAELHVLDRVERYQGLPPGVGYTRVDMAKEAYEKTLADFEPGIVFHLAASFERSDESCEFWDPNFADNVDLTHRLLTLLSGMEADVRFVFGSSYLIYDPRQFLKDRHTDPAFGLKEDSRVDPRNLCGAAKYYNERETLFISQKYPHISPVSARIFRVYGEGSRDVISRWVRDAKAGNPLKVFHKENQFDYIFAKDVAEAMIRLSVSDARDIPVNVGRGVPVSIEKVVEQVVSHFPDVEVQEQPQEGQYEKSYADIALLEEVTGWRPGISIEEGIGMIVEYERRNS